MKTLKQLLAVMAIILGVVACKDDSVDPLPSPEIIFDATEIEIAADGSEVSLAYLVNCAVEGESVNVDNTAEWLTVDATTPNVLKFSATQNETEEVREADVVVSYSGAESVTLKVRQLAANEVVKDAIAIELVSVDSGSITVDIITADPELTWIPMITYKNYFDEFESDDEIVASDMEYFEYIADVYDYTLEEFLAEMVGVGSESGIKIEDLDPETEYVVYAYGITTSGVRTTDVVSVAATTEPPYEGDVTFAFDVKEEDFTLEFTITPSHLGVDYFYGLATEAQINEWKELAGSDNLRDAIQAGDIDASINEYIDYGFISSRGEYFDMYTENSVMDWGWEQVEASIKYVIYAAKWNENAELVGSVSTYEHTTGAVEMSDNVITLEVTEVTQSSVTVSTTTTNYDSYVVMPVKAADIEGLTDDEIFAYVTSVYDYLVSEYTFNNDVVKTFKRMRPENDYTILTFGYQAGVMTTAMQKYEVRTLASGDPKDCTFSIEVMDIDTDNAYVEIIPSDKGHYYHWMAYPASYTAEEAKTYIQNVIENYYDNDISSFSSWELSQGDEQTTVWDLLPATEYKIGVVVMDYDTAEFLTEFMFGEPFTTEEVTYADILINVTFGGYFDADALIAAGYTDYADYAGSAFLKVHVSTEGECAEFYYDIYNNDLSDVVTYPDAIFYEGLWYGAWMEDTIFVVDYDKPQTFVAVAYDYSYTPTVLYREVLTFTKEGASPVEEWESASTSAVKSMVIDAPELSDARVDRKRQVEDFVYTSEFASKHNEAMKSIKESRRSAILKDIEARQAKRASEARRVAR